MQYVEICASPLNVREIEMSVVQGYLDVQVIVQGILDVVVIVLVIENVVHTQIANGYLLRALSPIDLFSL